MPSSTGTLVFNDQKIQAPDIYATESLGIGISDPTSNLEVVGNARVTSNLEVGTANLFVDTTTGRVGVGTDSPIAALDIDGGTHDDTTPALAIRGGFYDPSDLYVLNTYNVATGVGYAAKVIGVNIKNKVETDNTVQIRNNVGGVTSAGAIYLGSDNVNQGIFGVLGSTGTAGTTLSEHLTVRADGNVGIGITNPSTSLHVNGAISQEHYACFELSTFNYNTGGDYLEWKIDSDHISFNSGITLFNTTDINLVEPGIYYAVIKLNSDETQTGVIQLFAQYYDGTTWYTAQKAELNIAYNGGTELIGQFMLYAKTYQRWRFYIGQSLINPFTFAQGEWSRLMISKIA